MIRDKGQTVGCKQLESQQQNVRFECWMNTTAENENLRTTKSWQVLKQQLIDRYSSVETAEWNVTEFHACIQKRGESVNSYIDRLHYVANKLTSSVNVTT